MEMNRFEFDLAYSNGSSIESAFIEVYRQVWPNAIYQKVENLDLQKRGIDRIISYPHHNCKEIYIDEKMRRIDYGDIAIEEYSIWEERIPGWITAAKHTDYIAYGIEPARKVYLLPFELLRKAFRDNYPEWKKRRRFTRADRNNGYTTSFIPVEPKELFEAMRNCMQY